MKVLLAKDLKSLGMVGDVVEVADGYARNYLLPQRLALRPTEGNVKRVEELRRVAAEQRQAEMARTQAFAGRLNGAEVTIRARANEEGRLYGSVSQAMIAFALASDGYRVDEQAIELEEPIRKIDTYPLTVRLTGDITSQIVVHVVPDTDARAVEELEAEETDLEAVTDDEQGPPSSSE